MLGKVHFNIWVNYTSARDLTNYLSDNIPNQIKKYKDDEIRHCAHMQCHSFVGATHADPGRPDFISNWPMVGLQSPITSLLIQKLQIWLTACPGDVRAGLKKQKPPMSFFVPTNHSYSMMSNSGIGGNLIIMPSNFTTNTPEYAMTGLSVIFGFPWLWWCSIWAQYISSFHARVISCCTGGTWCEAYLWSERFSLGAGHLLAKYIRRPKKDRRRWWTVVTLVLKRTETKQQ